MKIQQNTVVDMHYRLTNDAGALIDESKEQPLSFVYGVGQIIPGLESALLDKQKGDKFDVKVAAKDAYGERNEAMTQEIPREHLAGVEGLSVGMQLEAQAEDQKIIVTVAEIHDKTVIIDGNHPLAGQDLNFSVEIMEVRQASDAELQGMGHS